jgi:hypothetical protein
MAISFRNVLFLLLSSSFVALSKKIDLVPRAINDIIENHFVKRSVNFDLVSCREKSILEQDVMSNVIKSASSVHQLKRRQVEISQSAIIICDSLKSLLTRM